MRERGCNTASFILNSILMVRRVTVSGMPFDTLQGRTWAGVGVSGYYAWAERRAINGEVVANSDLKGSYSVSATAGFKMRFWTGGRNTCRVSKKNESFWCCLLDDRYRQ